jgi:hypothetical protein
MQGYNVTNDSSQSKLFCRYVGRADHIIHAKRITSLVVAYPKVHVLIRWDIIIFGKTVSLVNQLPGAGK